MSSRLTVSHLTRFVRRHKTVLAVSVVVSVAMVSLYTMPTSDGKRLGEAPIAVNPDAPQLDKFVTHAQPKKLPKMALQTADGAPASLSDVDGTLLLVNFWATWCAPCRKEMPQLDALAARYQAQGVKIITLSVDRGGAAKGEKFLNELGVSHVVRLYDPSYKSARSAALIGLPTTLLLNARGDEIGRLAGEADWDTPPVHKMLDYYLSD